MMPHLNAATSSMLPRGMSRTSIESPHKSREYIRLSKEEERVIRTQSDKSKAPNQGIVSTDRSIRGLLYWIQHPDQLSSRIQVILRPDIEPEYSGAATDWCARIAPADQATQGA